MKKKKYFLICFGVIFISAVGFHLWQNYRWRAGVETSCLKIENHQIKGVSMEPVLKDGQEVKGLAGYYDCNGIKRGEIAVLEFKTREEAFAKRIVGLPGDQLEFIDGNQVKLNGKILKNSSGEPYLFSEVSQKIITIPLKDGKIPEERYFILSEEIGPSAFDSRQFGFVQKEHLKGRVIK